MHYDCVKVGFNPGGPRAQRTLRFITNDLPLGLNYPHSAYQVSVLTPRLKPNSNLKVWAEYHLFLTLSKTNFNHKPLWVNDCQLGNIDWVKTKTGSVQNSNLVFIPNQ